MTIYNVSEEAGGMPFGFQALHLLRDSSQFLSAFSRHLTV